MGWDMESAIFRKTALGQQEISQRSGLIGQKERQVLFMVDGARANVILASMLPNIDVASILLKMRDLGFIQAISHNDSISEMIFSGPTTVAPQLSADIQQKRQIEAARQVILKSTQEFLGQSWEDRLGELLSCVRRAEDLAPIVEQWAIALRRSGYRSAADVGEREVKAVLGQ